MEKINRKSIKQKEKKWITELKQNSIEFFQGL